MKRYILFIHCFFVVAGCYESKQSTEFRYELYGFALKSSGGESLVAVEELGWLEVDGEETYRPRSTLALFGVSYLPVSAMYFLIYGHVNCPEPFQFDSHISVNDSYLKNCMLIPTLYTDGGEGLAQRSDSLVILHGEGFYMDPEKEVSAQVSMPADVILMSPEDGDTFFSSDNINITWQSAEIADFYVVARHFPSDNASSSELLFLENTATEGYFDGGVPGEQIIVVMAVNGYTPESFPYVEHNDPDPNVSGVDRGMFLAISASAPVTVTVE